MKDKKHNSKESNENVLHPIVEENIHLMAHNNKLQDNNRWLHRELNEANKAITTKVWWSAIIITIAILLFSVVSIDVKYEAWQCLAKRITSDQ